MKKKPKVSLLILNWNGIAFTRKCLRSLLETTYVNFEIIVLDNGSIDNEKVLLEREFIDKRILFLRNKKNVGYARGMNEAYKHAKGEYIMILNNDMEFDPKWLQQLVNVLQNDRTVGACQPKIKDLKNKNYFEYAAAAGGYIDTLGYTFARGRIFSTVEKDNGQYDTQIPISWGGVLLIRKEVLKKVGFFDPIFFNYAEDVDLCFRIYGMGYKIIFVPSAVTFHFGGGALGKNLANKMFYIHRNHIILVFKNWSTLSLWIVIIPRVFLDVVSFLYYLMNGYSNISFALIKAYISLIFLFPKIIKARSTSLKLLNRENLKNMPMFESSIVWEYFFKKRRLFSQLGINR